MIVDALSALLRMGTEQAAFEYAIRLVVACKERGITCLFTNQLFSAEEETAFAGVGISSLVDTVILLRFAESGGMLHRTLLVRKVRGAAHSVPMPRVPHHRPGLELLGVYTGDNGIRTGYPCEVRESARRESSGIAAEFLCRTACWTAKQEQARSGGG